MKENQLIKNGLLVLSLLLLGLTFFEVWNHYSGLPERVPTHFGIDGKPNGFGGKVMLMLLPSVSAGVFLLLLGVGRYTKVINLPVPITLPNEEWQKQNARLLISFMQAELVLLFYVIIRENIRVAQGLLSGLTYLPLILMVSLFLTIAFFILRTVRGEK